MDIKIDNEIIKETTKCKRNYECLCSEGGVCCEVEMCVDEEVHFIYCLYDTPCNYKASFGDRNICKCPIRMEIYNKYKV